MIFGKLALDIRFPLPGYGNINIRNTEEAVSILPKAIILTKAHRAALSIMAKGCFVA